MKTRAVIEVVVVFAVTLGLVALAGLSPLGGLVRKASGRAFVEYAVMIVVPLLILLVSRRNLAEYGLSLHNASYHLGIAATAFIPVALASVPLMYVNYMQLGGSLIMTVVEIAVLFAVAWLLRRKPTMREGGMLVGAAFLGTGMYLAQETRLGNAVSALVFYVFFVGLGEELLFRGYIQSRLNAAFGRPFTFFGVNWGWGVIITAVLFGLMHVLNTGSLIKGAWTPTWGWGLWTTFGGLIGGFLREKTGSIAASAIVHGLPQGLAYAFLGL